MVKMYVKKNIVVCIIFIILTVVTTSAQKISNPFGNALIPDMIADASIQLIDGIYYCYATTDGYGKGLETSGPPVVWKSKDFVHWKFDGTYFPSALNQKYWAPSKVVYANNQYYIYPTINGYMYPAVSESPDGPFRLAKGKDEFTKPYAVTSTLLDEPNPEGIDAEVFIDDDGQAYVFWGRHHVAKLHDDMVTVDSDIRVIKTRREGYSEGPIFFKRNGIYYYLYTLGGDEKYQYAYGMSTVSPLGPYTFPEEDIITTTDYETGVFGPGHGSVFSDEKGNYYFTFLEFGRRSTNRQTYVNKMEFNEDGTIRPVKVNLEGVGPLNTVKGRRPLIIEKMEASSVMPPEFIEPMKDTLCRRTEYFIPDFAKDQSNGSRWMADSNDKDAWIVADLGKIRKIRKSEIYFVKPTAGHSYQLEVSTDGKQWMVCKESESVKYCSPHEDNLNGVKVRFVRLRIISGVSGIWEWNIY